MAACFRHQVSTEDVCHRFAAGTQPQHVSYTPRAVLEQLKQNLADETSVKFQFFALTTGLTVIYPAFHADDCSFYDARLR